MNIDQEWRSMLLGEIKELRKEVQDVKNEVHEVKNEMTTMKVKVALFSSFIGFVASIFKDKFF